MNAQKRSRRKWPFCIRIFLNDEMLLILWKGDYIYVDGSLRLLEKYLGIVT